MSAADLERDVTIVVVPRQRFSAADRTLESLYANLPPGVPVIYVDGNSPPAVRRYLEQQARVRGFQLIRTERYLAPNQARNIGFRHVATPYVVFVDNDILVAPGWLAALVRCAEETGAAVVGPLYCIGEPAFETVHMAGGTIEIQDSPAGPRIVDAHRFSDEPLHEVRTELRREPCDFAEFHCVLVRTEMLARLGGLDEGLLSTPEHLDLSLLVRELGGEVYFEPASMVNYLPARRLRWSDAPFYMLRWSDGWNRSSLRHFRQKWGLAENDPFLPGHYMWVTNKRMLVLGAAWRFTRWALGWRGSLVFARAFEAGVTRFILPRASAVMPSASAGRSIPSAPSRLSRSGGNGTRPSATVAR